MFCSIVPELGVKPCCYSFGAPTSNKETRGKLLNALMLSKKRGIFTCNNNSTKLKLHRHIEFHVWGSPTIVHYLNSQIQWLEVEKMNQREKKKIE